jgi:CYTH domain-containing protein
MAQEIERKFLVKGDAYKALAFHHSEIAQGYLVSGGGKSIRVRIRDDRGYLTIKGPSNAAGLSRYEFETEIPVTDARDLLRLCEPGLILKTRWLVRADDGHTFEVDEFAGDNEGLVMAEVELKSEDEPIMKPDFIGREVTGDHRFYNSHMRRYPYRLWRNQIETNDEE